MANDPLALLEEQCPDELAAAARLAAAQRQELDNLCRLQPAALNRDSSSIGDIRPPALFRSQEPNCSRMEDCCFWPISRIAAAFGDHSLDPNTLLTAYIERIERVDRRLNSFVYVDRDGATAAAKASSSRWAKRAPLGPLDGVPVGIKDVIDVRGMPTRCHSRVTSGNAAPKDAAIVERLRGSGAIILGKLATHEFAIGGPAFDLPLPPARNPWNSGHHPGGSSSGAGAAVAAGLVSLAIGTDTAGSVRHPASACGVVGLKPGRAVLPLAGIVPLAPTLDHVGLLTRTVTDMRIVAEAVGISLIPAPVGRVGYIRHFHTRDMCATAETREALDRAANALDAADALLPPLCDFALVNRIILQAEGYREHGVHLRSRPGELSYRTRAALLPGAFTSPTMLDRAMAERERQTRAVEGMFDEFDILLTASSMEPPCCIDDPAEIERTYMLQARTPFNVTGHPALTLFAGMAACGLPLSVQLVARMGEEGRLLTAATALENLIGNESPPISQEIPAPSQRRSPVAQ